MKSVADTLYAVDPAWYRDAPYLHLRHDADGTRWTGMAAHRLGHRVGENVAGHSDGVYAEWDWDGTRLEIRNDRYGMYPLYYYAGRDEFIVSPSICRILARGAPTELDADALAVFLRIGCFVGEDSAFRAVRAVPPAAHFTWQAGVAHIQGRYAEVRPHTYSYDSAIDGFIALFEAALARRIPPHDDFAAPLSGGRDSRHTLLALCAAGRPPRYCVTARRYPPCPTLDEEIAARVAARLGVPHVVVGTPPGEVAHTLAANVKTNFTAPRRNWKFALLRQLSNTVRASYDGIGGDMLTGRSALDNAQTEMMEAGRYEALARHLCVQPSFGTLLSSAAARQMDDAAALARLGRELPRHAQGAAPMLSFYFWNRTRRFDSSNPYNMLSDVPIVYAPFLDHALFDHLFSLTGIIGVRPDLHDDAIRRAYPRYRDLPFEHGVSSLRHDAGAMRRATADLLRFMAVQRPRHLLNRRYLLQGLMRRVISMGHDRGVVWWQALALYMTQLEAIAYHGALRSDEDTHWQRDVPASTHLPLPT